MLVIFSVEYKKEIGTRKIVARILITTVHHTILKTIMIAIIQANSMTNTAFSYGRTKGYSR